MKAHIRSSGFAEIIFIFILIFSFVGTICIYSTPTIAQTSCDTGDPCFNGDPCCLDPNSCGDSYCVIYTETDCYSDCWVIDPYGNCTEGFYTRCDTYSWEECY